MCGFLCDSGNRSQNCFIRDHNSEQALWWFLLAAFSVPDKFTLWRMLGDIILQRPSDLTFYTYIITDWIGTEIDTVNAIWVHLEKDLLLWMPKTSAHTAMQRLNYWHRAGKLSFSLWPWCQSESHCTSASVSMALTVMAAYPVVSSVLNCLFVPWEHSC